MRILVVEDSCVDVVAALQTILTDYELILATSYDEALKLLEKKDGTLFDVVLTNLFVRPVEQERPGGYHLAYMAMLQGSNLAVAVHGRKGGLFSEAGLLRRQRLPSEGCDSNELRFSKCYYGGFEFYVLAFPPLITVQFDDCQRCGGSGRLNLVDCPNCDEESVIGIDWGGVLEFLLEKLTNPHLNSKFP